MVSVEQARALALSLPGATEQDHHGRPSFRVAGKMFATLWDDSHMNVMLDEPGILTAHLHADGRYRSILCVPGQVQRGAVVGSPFVHMDGQGVFKFAVKVLAEVAHEALSANGLETSAIDWLIPHQANIRIMDATAKKLHVPPERMIATVDRHANTSAASIPLALDLAVRDGRIRPGQHVMLLGVGGGFTWGSVLLKW